MSKLTERQINYHEGREILPQYALRPMSPDDYVAWADLAGNSDYGAWPGLKPSNAEHDFVAMTKDTNISPAIFEVNRMVGASLNLVKLDPKEHSLYLLVHMIGVDRRMQGKGIGNRLMNANYGLITDGTLPETIQEVRLTSDPLETTNVRFYMHRNGMTVSEYIPDVYKNLAASGGEQHKGLPTDRFLYRAKPKSKWVQERVLPSMEDYAIFLTTQDQKGYSLVDPVTFVDIPQNLEIIKAHSMDQARSWRQYQAEAFTALFDKGYTAVDHIKGEKGQADNVVLMHGFDENDPECLVRALSQMN